MVQYQVDNQQSLHTKALFWYASQASEDGSRRSFSKVMPRCNAHHSGYRSRAPSHTSCHCSGRSELVRNASSKTPRMGVPAETGTDSCSPPDFPKLKQGCSFMKSCCRAQLSNFPSFTSDGPSVSASGPTRNCTAQRRHRGPRCLARCLAGQREVKKKAAAAMPRELPPFDFDCHLRPTDLPLVNPVTVNLWSMGWLATPCIAMATSNVAYQQSAQALA